MSRGAAWVWHSQSALRHSTAGACHCGADLGKGLLQHFGSRSISAASLCSSDTTVSGNCGSSSEVISDLGYGEALFQSAAVSSQGPIYSIGWRVSWKNTTQNTSNSFGRVDYPGTVNWGNNTSYYTNSGYVTATLSGSVELDNGGYCTIDNPADTRFISQGNPNK